MKARALHALIGALALALAGCGDGAEGDVEPDGGPVGPPPPVADAAVMRDA